MRLCAIWRKEWKPNQDACFLKAICRGHPKQNARCFICLWILVNTEWSPPLTQFHNETRRQRQTSLPWNCDYQKCFQLPKTNWYWALHQSPKPCWHRVLTLSTKPCVQTLLTSNWWQFFQQECERPKMAFSRLHYPNTLVENTIRRFIEMKDFENVFSKQQLSDEQDAAIRIVVPFKDQKSANAVSNSVISVERLMPMSSLPCQTKGT